MSNKEKKKICHGKEQFKTKCAGKIKTYEIDIDLPFLNLCHRHLWELMTSSFKKIGDDKKRGNG